MHPGASPRRTPEARRNVCGGGSCARASHRVGAAAGRFHCHSEIRLRDGVRIRSGDGQAIQSYQQYLLRPGNHPQLRRGRANHTQWNHAHDRGDERKWTRSSAMRSRPILFVPLKPCARDPPTTERAFVEPECPRRATQAV